MQRMKFVYRLPFLETMFVFAILWATPVYAGYEDGLAAYERENFTAASIRRFFRPSPTAT